MEAEMAAFVFNHITQLSEGLFSSVTMYDTDFALQRYRNNSRQESLEEDDLLMSFACFEADLNLSRVRVEQRQRITNFVSEVFPNYLEDDFARHFRLHRSTVECLIQEVGEDFKKGCVLGRPGVDLITSILLPIWTLSNQETFRGICDRFNVGKSHGYRIFCKFCLVMSLKVNTFIKWPQGEEMNKVRCAFDSLRAEPFPKVVGCVDGTYINIKGLVRENESYCNRKKNRAVILQGVCDTNKKFIDVFAGWPGSSHDARVWRNSPVYKLMSRY